MANTTSQQIQLLVNLVNQNPQAAAQLQSQLNQVAAAARQTGNVSQSQLQQITDLQNELAQAMLQAQRAGTGAQGIFGRLSGSVSDLTTSFKGLAAGAGVLAGVVAAIFEAANKTAEYARTLESLNRIGQLTSDQSAGLVLALKNIGAEAADAKALVTGYVAKLNEAREGSASARLAFERLGVSFADLQEKDPATIFFDIADGLKNLNDQESAFRGLSEIFGDDDAIKFSEIAGSLRESATQARALGLALNEKQIADAKAYAKEINGMKAEWDALATTIGTAVIPSLKETLSFVNSIARADGDAVTATGNYLSDLANSIASTFGENQATTQQFWGQVRAEAEATGQTVDQVLNGIRPVAQELSTSLGVNFEKLVAFTGANRQVLESVRQNADVFRQAAEAQKISVEQVIRVTAGSVELAQKLIQQGAAQKDAVAQSQAAAAATKTQEQNTIKLQGAVGELARQLSIQAETEKTVTAAADARIQKAKLAATEAQRNGATELQAAQQVAAATIEATKQVEAAALQSLRLRQQQIEATYQLERTQAAGNKDLIAKAEQEKFQALQTAQTEYDQKVIKTTQEREAAQTAVEKAAASEREKIRTNEFSELDSRTKRELALVDAKESQSVIRHRAAADERSQIRRNELAEQERIIQEQLAAENVGVDERAKLEEQLRQTQKKLRDENLQAEREALEAGVKDTEKAVAEKTAALSKQQAVLGQNIALVEASDATALQKAEAIADLKQRQISLEIQKTQAELDGARQNSAAKEKIIALETRLIELGGESIRVAGELGDAYRQAGQSAEEAANRAKASSEANLAAIYSFINGLVAQANSITRENVDEMMDYLEERVREASLALGNVGPQIAGLFEFYSQKANEALNLARKKQAEFEAEDARRRAEARRAEAERQAQEEASIRERALDAEQDANERLADAQSDYREGVIDEDKRWLAERQRIIDQGNQALANIEAQRAQARIQRAQDEANRLLQIARDLEDSREQAALESSQRQADSEFDRVNREIRLQQELEAAKTSGDPDKVAGIQSELAGIQADRNRDAQRAEEERLAREKATSDEELAILLDGIEEKYQRQEAYENAVAALGANASAAQLAQLQAAYQDQLASLEATKQAELANLAEREEQARLAREKEAQEQEAAFQKQIDDQKQRNIDLLTTAEQGHRDRLNALKQTLEDEKTAHAEAIANIRATLEAELAKMSEAWKKYASDTNATLGTVGGGSGGGSTAGGGVGGGNTAGVGGGTPTTTTGGTEPGGGATTDAGKPDRGNQEKKKRQISGYQDVLDAFEAGELTYDEANDQMNAILRAGGAATSGQYDTYYSFKNKLRALQARLIQEALAKAKEEGKAADQVDISKLVGEGEFKTDAANAALTEQAAAKQAAVDAITTREKEKVQKDIQTDLAAAASDTGIPDSLRELIDQVQAGALDDVAAYQTLDQQRGSLSPEQFTTVSKALVAARKAYLLKTGQLEKQFADQAAALYAQGDRGQRDTGRGGQQAGAGLGATPGASGTPGTPGASTTTTPPPAGTTEPPKPVRNAKLANDLLFQAQNATTLEQGQAVLKAATEALKAGTIDDDDRGRIRAALDSVAFQNNYLDKIDTAGLGQNAVTTKPGTPTPGRVSSVSDAKSALSSQAVSPPSQIFGTGSTNLDQIAGDLKPPPPQVAISIGDISGTNQDEIVTTVFAKLETQMRAGMGDAGIPA